LAFAVRQKRYKVVYQPLSEVVHYEGYSHGSDSAVSEISSIKEYQKINNQKFFEKWKAVLQSEQFPNAENVFWAKDRSRGKKTLLMVDHYVPQFDKDAGSRTTLQYLELFVKLGYNVKFLGENFYRHEPYTTVLQQMGIEVLYGPWYRDNWQQWFKENSEKFDYIYLNRPHISINFIDFFKQYSTAKIIYYGHDLHFLREQKKYEVEKDSAILEESEKWKKIELYLFGKSDVILTPSTDEQVMIKKLDPQFNVQLMRPYIYPAVQPPQTNFSIRQDILFVGGFGHLPNVDGVLWFVNEVWPIIKAGIPSARFIVAGSNPPAAVKALSSNEILIRGYVADDELERLYSSCKLAVIPLRYGAGVKGKTVEAMRFGLPLITTQFGVEGLPGDYSFIHVADSSGAFAEATINLYRDERALTCCSMKSVEYISNNFSEKVAQDIIINALATA
jgi:glycosyltransferase involved in cell wall biosynthesis